MYPHSKALAVFETKLFRTLQSRRPHIGGGWVAGRVRLGRDGIFGTLAKGDVSSSIALADTGFCRSLVGRNVGCVW